MQLRGGFPISCFKWKNPGEGFLEGRVFPTATPGSHNNLAHALTVFDSSWTKLSQVLPARQPAAVTHVSH